MVNRSSKRLGDRMEDYDYFRKNSRYLSIDKLYYLRSLINPIDQLLQVAIRLDDFVESLYTYHDRYTNVIAQLNRTFKPILCVR